MIVEELFSLTGKTALVTGASQGIGRMIAEAYVKAGARVYITSRKREACTEAALALSAFGRCEALPGDLSNLSEIARIADLIKQGAGKLHILVNNAGATWVASFEDFPERGWDKV